MSKENMNLGDFIIQGNKNRSEQSIFDSHAYYDHPLFNGDGPELVKRMHDIGALEHLVIPAITYESNHSAKALFFFDNARRYMADIERYSSVDDEARGNLYLEKDADDYADNMLREYLTLYRNMSLRRIDSPMGLSLYRWALVC